MYKGRKIFLVAGPGGSGKDTVARMIARLLGMNYVLSTSAGAAEAFWNSVRSGSELHRGFASDTYPDFGSFYGDRVNHRAAWVDFISEFNREDQTRLYRYVLEQGCDFL